MPKRNSRIIAGPKDSDHGREWYSITAKQGVGEVHIFDFIDAYGINGRSFLKDLKAIGQVSVLNVHINSPGGDVFEGNTIYNLLKNHPATVNVYVTGLAASIASVIAMAGDKIIMPKNAMMMIHDPAMMAFGTADDMRKNAGTLDKVKQTLVAAYQTKTGLNEAEIKTIMTDETWFTADEAVAMKFADEVADEVKIAAAWSTDLSKFKNTPRDFLAVFADSGSAKEKPGTHRPSAGETDQEKTMLITKLTILALASVIGLAQSNELTNLADKLVTDKADLDKVIAELQKMKPAETKALSSDEITAAVAKATKDARDAERQRVTDIKAAAGKLKLAGVKEFDTVVNGLIDDGSTIDAAREMLFEAAVKLQEKGGHISTFSSGSSDTFDNPEFRRDAFATAFAARHSNQVKMTDQAKPYAYHSILDLAVEMLAAQGVRLATKNRELIVIKALHSTSDFPYLLGDVANKILLPAYTAAQPAYKAIAAQKTFNDFKPTKFLRIGDFPTLLAPGEGGEIKLGTISESKEAVTLATYARRLSVTRQMLINDDLSAFADMAGLIGRRVPAFENATVFALLALNSATGPTMSDTFALFDSTNHGNYTSSGTAVNLPIELGKLSAKMQKQTGLDGLKLNLEPRILLVGPDNTFAADQVTTLVTPTTTSGVNKIGPSLTRVADANVAGYNWYLIADPNEAPAIIWGSLPGQAGPMVNVQQGWEVSGVEIKVERDFGCGAIDYRGIAMNAGSAPS
jgi:ATP-dependent protease ClpP protease subunit